MKRREKETRNLNLNVITKVASRQLVLRRHIINPISLKTGMLI